MYIFLPRRVCCSCSSYSCWHYCY